MTVLPSLVVLSGLDMNASNHITVPYKCSVDWLPLNPTVALLEWEYLPVSEILGMGVKVSDVGYEGPGVKMEVSKFCCSYGDTVGDTSIASFRVTGSSEKDVGESSMISSRSTVDVLLVCNYCLP